MDLSTVPTPHLQRIAETLWDERHVLEQLLHRLTSTKLLLSADLQRFVAVAIDEVEQTIDRLHQVELVREGVVEEVARMQAIPLTELSLAALAARSPAPWNVVFSDHRRAFLELAAEIEETTAANRGLASQALGDVRRAIAALEPVR